MKLLFGLAAAAVVAAAMLASPADARCRLTVHEEHCVHPLLHPHAHTYRFPSPSWGE